MVADRDSAELLMSIFSGKASSLSEDEQVHGLIMACANLIESAFLACCYGNPQEAEEGLHNLVTDMVRNIYAKAKRGSN